MRETRRWVEDDDLVLGDLKLRAQMKWNETGRAAAAGVMAGFLATEQTRYLFLHSPLYAILIPVLAITLTVEAYLEYKHYRRQTANKKRVDYCASVRLLTTILAAVAVDFSVGSGLMALTLGGAVVFVPWMLLAAFACLFVRTLTDMFKQYQYYRQAHDPEDRAGYRNKCLSGGIKLVLLGLMSALVVGLMLCPFSAPVLFSLTVATAVLATLQAVWHVIPKEKTKKLKQQCGLFPKEELYADLEFNQARSPVSPSRRK